MKNENPKIDARNSSDTGGLPVNWFVSGGLFVLSMFVYASYYVAHLA